MLSKYHGKIIKESQHEHLEEVHEHKQLKVPVGQDLPRKHFQRGEGARRLAGSLIGPGFLRITLIHFIVKTALAVKACVEHAATAQDSNQHSESLKRHKVFHVFGHHATEKDTGGADERSHLGNEQEGI